MDLIRFSIQKPVTISVGVLLVLLFGLISLSVIPIQLTPTLETTVVSVTTRWEGASPQEVEREIVREQEEKFKSIQALKRMVSVSEMGNGQVTLEFAEGTTKEAALREVSDKLREVQQYPQNVDEPVVEARNPADRDYIAWVVISCTDPGYDIRKLYDFFDDRVKPELERVPGVGEVNVLGGWEREVHVKVDPQRLAQRSIGPERFVQALRNQNRNASAGEIAEGKLNVRIRSVGRYERLEEIEQTLLSNPGEPVVRVSDVARVELGYKEPIRTVRNKGRVVMAINAQREVGSNVIEVMRAYQAVLDNIRKNILPIEAQRRGLNGQITMEQVYDQTLYIHQAVDLVLGNLWWAAVLTVVVLLLFLRSLRSTFIVALSIPTSLIGTFLVMAAMGRSLNVISLAGLAFAVGVVVDNAIVVLENIDRHRKLGQSAGDAVYRGTREVWGAILASSLTTIAVFIPVVFMREEAGQLFRDISLAIVAAVILSLLVAVTVIPSAANRWLPPIAPDHAQRQNRWLVFFSRLNAGFARSLEWLMRSWALRLGVIAGLTSASLVGSYLLMPPSSYLPPGNRNLVFAGIYTPPGYNLQQQEEIGARIEDRIRPYWEAAGNERAAKELPTVTSFDPVTQKLQTVKPPPLSNFFFVALPEQMFMGGTSEDDRNVRPIASLFNDVIRSQPVLNGFAAQSPLFRTALRGSGDAIELEISGPDLDRVNSVAQMLRGRYIAELGGPQYVRPDPSNFDLPGLEVHVTPRLVEAADLGLTQQDINSAVQVLGDGAIVGDFLHEGDTIDLKVLADGTQERGDATYLRDAPIATPVGRVVPLHSVAEIRRVVAPQQISRVMEQRAVTLSINVPQERALEEVIGKIATDIEKFRADGVIPPDITTRLAGSAAKLSEVKNALLGRWSGWNYASLISLIGSRMFLALLVTYLLMAALFESWLYPFVIMFAVPPAIIGGFAALRLVHEFIPTQQLDVLTMLGFVILIGTVVNNAILIVHQSLNLMRGKAEIEVGGRWEAGQRLAPNTAIVEATRTRIRPIFMTAITTIVGTIPLVLYPGAGSELYRGLGAVVLGGLTLSTVFTLVLVPLLLSVLFQYRTAMHGRATRE